MKTTTKVEQEIVVKRTNIEYEYEEDDDDDKDFKFIFINFSVFIPGYEHYTDSKDEESWGYDAATQKWDLSNSDKTSVLYEFFGTDNYNCIHAILDDLKDNEVITARYTISVETKNGHSLPTCGDCKYWSRGYCKIIQHNMPENRIRPCPRELFEPETDQ